MWQSATVAQGLIATSNFCRLGINYMIKTCAFLNELHFMHVQPLSWRDSFKELQFFWSDNTAVCQSKCSLHKRILKAWGGVISTVHVPILATSELRNIDTQVNRVYFLESNLVTPLLLIYIFYAFISLHHICNGKKTETGTIVTRNRRKQWRVGL